MAGVDRLVTADVAGVMNDERTFGRLGALSRGGAKFVPVILERARRNSEAFEADRKRRSELAYALGAITHYAADKIMKPLMGRLAGADWNQAHHDMQKGESGSPSIREISAYYDIEVFRKVYLAGREEPFSAFLTSDNSTEPGKALAAFVDSLFQRSLLSSHTLAPDLERFDEWFDNLYAKVQPLYISIDLYTRIFMRPDAEKLERYAVASEFYREVDPAAAAARAIQLGSPVSPEELSAAIESTENRGGYGRAIVLGMTRLRDATRYLTGSTDVFPDLSQ